MQVVRRVGGGWESELTAGESSKEDANVHVLEGHVGVRGADNVDEQVEPAILKLKFDPTEGLRIGADWLAVTPSRRDRFTEPQRHNTGSARQGTRSGEARRRGKLSASGIEVRGAILDA